MSAAKRIFGQSMRIISDLSEFHERKCALAIGKFDGVHRGHRKLIGELVREARARSLTAAVFTFNPPPAVLFGGADAQMLLPKEEQRKIFARMGVDVLVEFPFTKEAAATPPETFVREILTDALHAALVVCGSDVSFGAGGRGNLALLRELSAPCGYEVLVVEKLMADGAPISSTRIRQALREGHAEEARALLGD